MLWLYDMVKAIVECALLSLIPLLIGMSVKKPIPMYICVAVSIVILCIFAINPNSNNIGNVWGGIGGAVGAFLCLYFLSRRKSKDV